MDWNSIATKGAYVPPAKPSESNDPSGVWKFFDYLQRGFYGVSGGINAALDPTDERNVLTAAVEGLTGKKRISGEELLKNIGVPEGPSYEFPLIGEKNVRDALGLGAEIALDPINYLSGMGVLTKLGKTTKTADIARLVDKASDLGKVASEAKLSKALVPVESTAGKSWSVVDDAIKALSSKEIVPYVKAGELATTGAKATDHIINPEIIQEARQLGKTLSERVEKGQATMLGARLPFSEDYFSILPKGLDVKLAKGAEKVGDALGNIPGAGLFKSPFASDPLLAMLQRNKISNESYYNSKLIQEIAPKIIPVIKELEKNTGKKWSELGPVVMEIAEKGGIENIVPSMKHLSYLDEASQAAQHFVDANKTILQTLREAGVPVSELNPEYGLNYMKHIVDPELSSTPIKDAAQRLYSVGGDKQRVYHWKFQGEELNNLLRASSKEEAKSIIDALPSSGYIWNGSRFRAPESIEDITSALSRGEEFRLSHEAAKGLLGENRAANILKNYAREGASSVAEQNLLADTAGKFTQNRLYNDPLTSLAGSIRGAGHRAASAEMAAKIAANPEWARPINKAPKSWVKMDSSLGPTFKNMSVDPEIYKELTKTFAPSRINKNIEKFIQGVGEATGWWTTATLGVPAYTIRNMVGNFMFNAYGGNTSISTHKNAARVILAGMAKDGKDATVLQKLFSKVGVKPGFWKGSIVKNYSNEQLWEMAKKLGVEDSQLIGRLGVKDDISGAATYGGLNAMRKVLQREGEAGTRGVMEGLGYFRNMSVLNHAVEAQGRMALFIHNLELGKSPSEAAAEVAKWMMDYAPQALSEFERNYVKKLIPFYTFWRRNTATQIEMLLQTPSKIVNPAKMVRSLGQDIPENERRLLPSWWAENLPIKFANDPETGAARYADLSSYVPFTAVPDLLSNLSDPLNKGVSSFVNSFTPLLKLPMELATGTSSYSRKPIERYEGEMGEMGGIPMRKRTQHIFRTLARPVKELDNLNLGNAFGEQRQGRWQQAEPDERLLSFLTGFRAMPLDVQKRAKQVTIEQKQLRNNLKNALKDTIQMAGSSRVSNNPFLKTIYDIYISKIRKKLENINRGGTDD